MAGFLERLARGIKGATIDPITKMWSGGTQLVRSFADPILFGKEYKPRLSGATKFILDDEQERALLRDPLQEGLKGTAGSAALGVSLAAAPAVAGAGSLGAALGLGAGTGAISGGLSGLAGTDDIRDEDALLDVLSGGLTGSAFGGAGAGIGYGLQQVGGMLDDVAASTADDVAASSLDDIGSLSKIQRKGLEMQAKGSGVWDDTLSQSENIKNFIRARRAGVAGAVPRQTLENAKQAEAVFLNQKATGLSEIASQTDDDLIGMLANTDDLLSKGGQSSSTLNSRAWQNVQDSIVNTGGDPQLLDDLAMRYQDLAYTSRGAKKTVAAEVYDKAAKSIRDHLKAQSPTYRAAEEGLASIYQTIGKTPVKQAARSVARQGVGSPLVTGDKIPLPTRTVGRAAQSGLGQIAERGLRLPSGAVGAAGEALETAAPSIMGAGPLAGSVAGGQPMQEAGGLDFLMEPGKPAGAGGTTTSDDIRAALVGPAQQREAERAQLFNSLISMGMSTSEAKTMTDVNLPKVKAPNLSDTQSKALGVWDLINNLESAQAEGGTAGSYFLPVGTQAKNVRASRKALAEAIGRMQSGGAISSAEEKRFIQMIPSITDTAESGQYKLDLLRDMVINLVTSEQETNLDEGDIISELAGF